MAAARLEQRARLALQPALHDIAQPIGASVRGQADVEPRKHAGAAFFSGGSLVKRALARRKTVPRVEDDTDRPTEEHELGAVAPDHARPLGARRLGALPDQLGENPAALLAHGGVELAQPDPLRRADRKALGTDDEANAAPTR